MINAQPNAGAATDRAAIALHSTEHMPLIWGYPVSIRHAPPSPACIAVGGVPDAVLALSLLELGPRLPCVALQADPSPVRHLGATAARKDRWVSTIGQHEISHATARVGLAAREVI